MKIKILFASLLTLVLSNNLFSQSVVVNKYQNVGTAADIIELLVVQDNLDMRNLVLKSFSSSNANDNGGSITFNNIAFWSSMRAGTLIVVRLTSTGATDITTSCTDFNLDIGASNTTYFTVTTGSTFDVASNDMVMIKSGTTTGTANNIHTLRAGTAAAQWTAITTGTRLGTTSTVAANSFATVANGSSVIGDYNLGTSGVTVGTGFTFGSGNNANNTNFITFLRGPVSSAATSLTDVSFSANWGALTGAASYILDVATDSGFTSLVAGYTALNVGNVTTYSVTGLSSGGTYYYRVRALNATPTTSGNSCPQTVNLAKVTTQNGDWGLGATWVGGVVPASTDNVVVKHNVFQSAANSATVTRSAGTTTTVDPGATLATADIGVANTNTYINNGTTTINGTYRVEDSGSVVNSGNNFVYGSAGTLNFNNTSSRTVNATDKFWPAASGPMNVNVVGDISMAAGVARTVPSSGTTGLFTTATKAASGVTCTATSPITINGTLRIDNGGGFAGPASSYPIYGASSLLIYNTGVTTNRSNEWNATGVGTIGTTSGYPNNVQVSSNTTLTYNSNTVARAMAGNFTIDTGCTFNMSAATTSDLTVAGALTNSGTLTFSNATSTGGNIIVTGNFTNFGTSNLASPTGGTTGGNLKLAGNFSNATSGVFNCGNRAVYFTKLGVQTIANGAASTLTFGALYTTGGGSTPSMLSNLIIAAPANTPGTTAISYGNAADFININSLSLTIGTPGVANTISGSGGLRGSSLSNLTLLGTGSIGTLKFVSNLNLATFTMDRTTSTVGCVMGSALTINTNVVFTNGHIDLGANTMTFASGVNSTGSAGSHIIADVSAGGILNKVVTATGTNYVFPIGSGGTEYAPATVNFSAGSFASATLGMAVENTIHPNWNSASTAYINRYWSLTSTGITTPTYDFSATYPATDVVGTIGPNFKSNQWDGTDWTNGGIAITSGTISKTGCTINSGTNHISAAIRDQEIEVKSGVSGITIPNGTTTTAAFGNAAYNTVNVGNNLAHTFSVYNKGGVGLNLTNVPIVEILPGASSGDFVVTTQPSSSTVGAESSLTFVITFTPSYAGYRTATVRIYSNDADENPYTFVVDGTGDCAVAATNTITPTSGPVGTEVTITATANNLTSATATFNGVSASVTQIDATHITAIVPTGAVSGTLVTTNSIGCQASNTFTVIDNASTSCQGGSTAGELFMSEVTDSNYGSLTYIEIYNGTGSSKNLGTYSIKVANNGGAYTLAMTLNSVVLASGSSYVVAFGNDSLCGTPGGNGSYASQTSAGSSVNFAANGHDHYGLFNGATLIDSWGTFGSNNWAPASISTEGVTFRRKNTATLPSTTYSNSDWNIIDFLGSGSAYCGNNDYSDIGTYNFKAGNPPSVTTLTYTPTCKGTTLTVTGTEGFSGGNALVYTWYAVQNGSNTWNVISDGGIYSGATTNALTISNISTVLNYQFYCQVRENTATCYIASNAVKITLSQSTTWQAGNTWSNGVPTINTAVVIDNDYDTTNGFSPSFDACSVTINGSKNVTVRANDYINIQNDLTVTGTLSVENNGSLVMIDDTGAVTNTGTTQIKRTASNVRGYDYVYWASPVTGQSVDTFYSSPTPGYKYKWNPLASNINSPLSSGTWQPASGTMSVGTGYIVRGSSSFGMPASSIPGIFTGAVNNGVVPVTINRGSNQVASSTGPGNGVTVTNLDDNWNLVGNPYPSSIKALDFLTYNTNIQGFVYLWTHGTAPVSTTNPFYNSFQYNYTSSDYITYNGTATTSGPSGFNGYIAAGQGFFIVMNDGATGSGTVNFKNSMRNKTYGNTQFYRTSQVIGSDDRNRIWLDLVDSNNVPVRTVVGYVPDATLGMDRLYDAIKNTANEANIYSLVDDNTLIIQGRPVPFDSNDRVPIGVRIMQDGQYKIAIAAVDGLFSNASQNIYLEDKLLGITHDLRQNPYSFTANAGIVNDRFVLKYTGTALGNPDFGTVNDIILTSNQGQMSIKSSIENIQEVTVYDILGRQLFEAKSIGNKDFSTSGINAHQQALVVKIKLENGTIVTRKIIL